MEDPFLNQQFTVKFQPANALSTTLHLFGMMKFHTRALLTLLDGKKFQIKADTHDLPGLLSLEMEADSISATFDHEAYCLRFIAENWYQQISNLVIGNPSPLMSIKKSPGSSDVHCLFGEDNQMVELGKAEFVERIPRAHSFHGRSYPRPVWSYVRVLMGGVMFRHFLDSFSAKHDHAESAVELEITQSNISWITRRGRFDYPLADYAENSSIPQDYKFPVRWDWFLSEMLRAAALCGAGVELTVFDDKYGEKLYRFLFLYLSKNYYISYVEKVPEETPAP